MSNRFADPLLTSVEGYRACTSCCCWDGGGTLVLVRDEGGYLRERHTDAFTIVAGTPNLTRLEKWEAQGRPEFKPFPLPTNQHGGSWRRNGIPA